MKNQHVGSEVCYLSIIIMALCVLPLTASAQTELLTNGGAESGNDAGSPVGWTEIFSEGTNNNAGDNWVATSIVFSSFEGSLHFLPDDPAGNVNNMHTLEQVVDVSTDGTTIDNGNVTISFSGYINTDLSDQGKFTVDFLNGSDSVIETYDSGFTMLGVWTNFSDSRTAPVNTRSIRVRLVTKPDDNGVVDVGFDDLSLTKTVSTTIPTVTTTAASGVGSTSATLGGDVTADGGASVSARGVVWNTTGNPDLPLITEDNVAAIGMGTGVFSNSIGLLPFGTTIYYRAYATNTAGTAYGSEDSFTTTSASAISATLTGAEGWRLLSIPANVQLSTFLGPIWTQGVSVSNGGDAAEGLPNVFTWDLNSPDDDVNDWNAVTDLNTTLSAGTGFLVYVYSDDDFDGTPEGFSKTLPLSGSEYASGTSPTLNSTASGWTLLGNPFGSAITYSDLTTTSLQDVVYIWNPNDNDGDDDSGVGEQPVGFDSGSWNTWNGSAGNITDGRIASFQGFFVQNSSSGTPDIDFTQSGKTQTATTFVGKTNPTPFVHLEIKGNGMHNSAWLEFSSDGSENKTTGDAWELTPLSTNYALLATQKNDGALLDIGRYNPGSDFEIPLITEATQTGLYTLRVNDMDAAGLPIYLNDLQTGESLLLENDMRYEFMIDQVAKAKGEPGTLLNSGIKKKALLNYRFVISSSVLDGSENVIPDQFTLQQNYPNPFNPTTLIEYNLPQESMVSITIYDMMGREIDRLINEQMSAGVHQVSWNAINRSSGIYIYRLETSGEIFTKKMTLIK